MTDGVTKRQLQYWVARGYITPDVVISGGGDHGEGDRHVFSERTHRVIRIMGRLRKYGLEAWLAAEIANAAAGLDPVDTRILEYQLGPGAGLTVSLDGIEAGA